jgi:very-short-patch-repair endonuclease
VTREPGLGGSKTSRPGIRLHIAALPREHRAVRLGAPVTSVARTVIDLARTIPFREGVVVADSALRRELTTKAELGDVMQAFERWPGIRKAREVVEFSDGRAESAFESISRVVFRDARLPPPELQVWVGADGIVIARVDFLWRKYATIGEADGAVKYADPDRAKMQLRRDAELREAGFEVVHFTWQELHINPGQVVRSIRTAFARNAALRAAARA